MKFTLTRGKVANGRYLVKKIKAYLFESISDMLNKTKIDCGKLKYKPQLWIKNTPVSIRGYKLNWGMHPYNEDINCWRIVNTKTGKIEALWSDVWNTWD